ncbi:MAG: DUF2281 domain-containing protein [Burkholderiales bacterium]|nr:DUF2281 domain-containing protein [Phycisphaerae bacterium]
MSAQTQELLNICEELPEAKLTELADFARFLLAQSKDAAAAGATQRWLETARGAAKSGVTTDEVMNVTRGEQ